jgi:predicted histidine transporter YuiF (NhaC family)
MNIDYITIQLNKLDNAMEFATLFIIIGGLVAAFYYIKNRKKDEANALLDRKTITAYKDNNAALEERLAIVEAETQTCLKQHEETTKLLNGLKHELKVYDGLILVPKRFLDDIETRLIDLKEDK